jgi:hypothetical protein
MSTDSIGSVSAVDLLAVAAAGLAAGTASADLLEDEPEHPAPVMSTGEHRRGRKAASPRPKKATPASASIRSPVNQATSAPPRSRRSETATRRVGEERVEQACRRTPP